MCGAGILFAAHHEKRAGRAGKPSSNGNQLAVQTSDKQTFVTATTRLQPLNTTTLFIAATTSNDAYYPDGVDEAQPYDRLGEPETRAKFHESRLEKRARMDHLARV